MIPSIGIAERDQEVNFSVVSRRPELDIWHSPPGTGVSYDSGIVVLWEVVGSNWIPAATALLPSGTSLSFARRVGTDLDLFVRKDQLPYEWEFVSGQKTVSMNCGSVVPDWGTSIGPLSSFVCGQFGGVLLHHGDNPSALQVSLDRQSGFPASTTYDNLFVGDATMFGEEVLILVTDVIDGSCWLVFLNEVGLPRRTISVPFPSSEDKTFLSWRFAGATRSSITLVSCGLNSSASARTAKKLKLATVVAATESWTSRSIELAAPTVRLGRLPGDVPDVGSVVVGDDVVLCTSEEVTSASGDLHAEGRFLAHALHRNQEQVVAIVEPVNTLRPFTSEFPVDRLCGPGFIPQSAS
jgi:hypothetical protein